MMEPDFNDDDLIDDYIEDSFEPPPGYEDDFLEEMMMDHGSGPAATASTKAITSKSTSGVEAATNGADLMEEEELDEEDVNINVAQVETSPTDIREVYDKRRDVHKSIYAFERYNPQNTNWGTTSGNNGSPNNTMRAKEWKTSKTATADNSSKIWEGMDTDRPSLTRTLVANRPKATAPDAQLLHFLATKHSRPKKIELPKHRMLHNPVAGNASLPMTLGDGTRVHVRVRKPSESTKKASVGASNMHALGTPIAELMFRVQAIRRKQAHERQEQVQCELLQGNDKNDTSRGATEIEDKLWVDKHAPSSFAHLLSDERTNREVVRALRAWDPYVFHREPPKRPDFGYRLPQQDNNNKQAEHAATKETDTKGAPAPKASKDRRPDEMSRVILLSGPPGVGKTTLAHIIALHAGYRPLEVNGSDERSASILTERLVRAMESTTLNVALMQGGGEGSKPKPNCLILDEIDGADAKDAVQSLVNIIRAEIPAKGSKGKNKTTYLRRPIIFICNNKYAPALRALLPFAKQFNVFPPSPHRLVARLRSVLGAEKMSVFGGSSLLNQLVASTCGDIRSCLYTLQFASSRARELASLERHSRDRGEALRDSSVVDISQSLGSALNGDGMKDQRNDVAGTITTIFRKKKEKAFGELFGAGKDTRSSTVRVLDSVESFGDNSRMLDCLFMNILRVSYIDPTFDRCAAAHEWLSSSDVYRTSHALERLHIPSSAAAVHFLCRVEQRPDLTYTTRYLSDGRYQQEANFALTQKFVEGLSPQARGSRCVNLLATETIPYALWILSAGEGSSSLDRAASSMDILSKGERRSLDMHVSTLQSLGLTYVAAVEENARKDYGASTLAMNIRLEPPIERLVQFVDLNLSKEQKRHEIPPAMKEVLAQRAAHERMRAREQESVEATAKAAASKVSSKPSAVTSQDENIPHSSKKRAGQAEKETALPPAKRPKASMTAQNFLGIGAKKAKEARSARTAARVGVNRSQKNKASHTGSGVPFPQVIRLKYVKGFTQAVRTPCRLEDLQ